MDYPILILATGWIAFPAISADSYCASFPTVGVYRSIQFWDLNSQKLLSKQFPVSHRVIPYPETIAWIGEDTLVAVSHLKDSAAWRETPSSIEYSVPTMLSSPETQTCLLTISWSSQGKLNVHCATITSTPHSRAIRAVAPAKLDENMTSYITGGRDKTLVIFLLCNFSRQVDNGVRLLLCPLKLLIPIASSHHLEPLEVHG